MRASSSTLCFVALKPSRAMLRQRGERSGNVQQQMSFLEANAPGAVAVWARLDDAQRAVVVAALARVIVKMTLRPDDPSTRAHEEPDDE